MALTGNPTRTRKIENNWMREINRRWKHFTNIAVERLDQMNGSGLALNDLDDPFVMSPEQQRIYIEFLKREIDRILLGEPEPLNWQNKYQLEAYMRGLETTRAQLEAQGADVVPTIEEQFASYRLDPFTATSQLDTGGAAMATPIHRDALEFLYTRAYETLENWTNQLAVEGRQVLFDAVEQGYDVAKTTRNLVKRIDVSRTSAQRIARTETNQAYSRATINEADRASVELDEDIQVRWFTARDSHVRLSHAELHGKVMPTKAASLVKMHDGINCRCSLAPVVPGTNTAKRRKKFRLEREALLGMI